MEYKYPWLFILGLVFLILWSLDFWKIKYNAELGSFKMKKSTESNSFIYRLIIYLIGTIGICYLSYALMGPRTPESYAESSTEVLDIYLVVDVSRSMLADDIRPNRLEAAKEKLRSFAKLKHKDRLGVVIFSEKVFTLLPLTIDPKLVERIIESIEIGYLGSGTNIGDALALAVARLQITETKNKVVVLLTDGVSNVGNFTPIQAAEEAKKYGIRVYTIGFGTESDARIPVGQGIFGTQYQRIPGGSVDFKSLKEISDKTGGKAYTAQTANALEKVFLEIDQLERTETKIQGQVVYDEQYYRYLLIGLLLYFLSECMRFFWIRERV